jgi:hypothetical protein
MALSVKVEFRIRNLPNLLDKNVNGELWS